MECKCCKREQELRLGFCFDCVNAESLIEEAAEKVAKLKYGDTIYGLERVNAYIDGAYQGAKWMQKQYNKQD